ncbi:hypothetical protein [Foetidibacter luteolus]|uniref:hypothetical protein n=1 Tax=Foetidibacter luteolus TaxID=2608880 RepID=UPI00129B315D|nr:hypothetical protein [Foetidibacter luteolus]
MKRDDILWKGILENVFDDFLRFFFSNADELFDMEKGFAFLDKELAQLYPQGEGTYPKFVDKLVKVFLNDGREEWILVHIEVQGHKDAGFEKRMFTYFYRILDRYDKPVTAIAILTDSNKNFKPGTFAYNCLGTSAVFRFNSYKIIEEDEERLLSNSNPFSVVVLTVLLAIKQKRVPDDNLLQLKVELAKNLLRREIPLKKVRELLVFLKSYVRFAKKENNAKFEQKINDFTGNKTTMGIVEMLMEREKKEGMLQGNQEARIAFVKNLLQQTDFSIRKIAQLADVTEAFVRKIKKSL